MTFRATWLLNAVLAVAVSARSASSQTAPAAIDLVPPLSASSAQIGFNEGTVTAEDAVAIDQNLPKIPGPASPYYLVQWNHKIYTKPSDLWTTHSSSGPNYAFFPSDYESGVNIYKKRGEPGLTYSLYNSNGIVTDGGGRATYLQAAPYQNVATGFDQEIDLNLDIRLSFAKISYTTPTAEATGAVLAQGYTGIGLLFVDPANIDPAQFVFMQVVYTISGNFNTAQGWFVCSAAGLPVIYTPSIPANQVLRFVTDHGPLHHMTYNLSSFVQQMLAQQTSPGCASQFWDAAKLNAANWHFAGFYFGTETENTDGRAGAVTSKTQGNVQIAADLANLSIQRLAH